MTRYFPGDVVIASVKLRGPGGNKSRPAVVRQPDDCDFLPLSLDDFEKGGLDLFGESYVLVSEAGIVEGRYIHGKRGRLRSSCFMQVSGRVRL